MSDYILLSEHLSSTEEIYKHAENQINQEWAEIVEILEGRYNELYSDYDRVVAEREAMVNSLGQQNSDLIRIIRQQKEQLDQMMPSSTSVRRAMVQQRRQL